MNRRPSRSDKIKLELADRGGQLVAAARPFFVFFGLEQGGLAALGFLRLSVPLDKNSTPSLAATPQLPSRQKGTREARVPSWTGRPATTPVKRGQVKRIVDRLTRLTLSFHFHLVNWLGPRPRRAGAGAGRAGPGGGGGPPAGAPGRRE